MIKAVDVMDHESFFRSVSGIGQEPYPYQQKLPWSLGRLATHDAGL